MKHKYLQNIFINAFVRLHVDHNFSLANESHTTYIANDANQKTH